MPVLPYEFNEMHKICQWTTPFAVLTVVAAIGSTAFSQQSKTQKKPVPAPAAKVNFAKQIAPIFKANCLGCHSGPHPAEGIALDTKANILKGGVNGPILVAGKPAESTLVQCLTGNGAMLMPPNSKGLPKQKIALIAQWVKEGAKF